MRNQFHQLRLCRFRNNHGADFATGFHGFFHQVRTFGHGEAIVGERAALHRAADLFHKRIVFAERVHVYNDSEPENGG
jgi:hypothetical protein